jgi:hypothetical protein
VRPAAGSRTAAVLAGLACVAGCALPLLVAAGVLSTTGAALLRSTLPAVAAGLATAALALWWLHRRRAGTVSGRAPSARH